MARELNEPLMIRAELEYPSTLIYSHRYPTDNPHITLDYVERQAQAIAQFEDMERLFGDNCIHVGTRRWKILFHSPKIREYQSPTRMREAMRRVSLYKQSMQNLKANWIGLKFSPPLLLGLLEGVKEEEDKRQWEEVDRKAGFHDGEEDITSEAWDVIEAVKAIKDDELDYLLRG